MLRILTERIKEGVEVKILGKVEAKWGIKHEKFPGKRLHVRAIIRDGERAFVGSQSLRRLELEKRREIGVVVTDKSVVDEMKKVFEHDWAQTESGKKEAKQAKKASKKEEKELAAVSKSRTAGLGAIILAASVMLAPGLATTALAQEAYKQTASGAEVDRTYCASCHGTDTRGDGPVASAMVKKPAPEQ